MPDPRDLLVGFNPLVVPQTVLVNLLRGDWKAARTKGPGGIAAEALCSAIGANTFAFFVPVKGSWGPAAIRDLLAHYGVKMWGACSFNGEYHFRVELRQAHWAQYVMLRAGVPLIRGMFDGSRANPGYGQSGQAAEQRHPLDHLDNLLDSIAALLR